MNSRIAPANAMLTDRATRPASTTRKDVRTYKGFGVSLGIAIGRAVIIERREASVFRVPIREEDVPSEVNRFLESLEKTREERLTSRDGVRSRAKTVLSADRGQVAAAAPVCRAADKRKL